MAQDLNNPPVDINKTLSANLNADVNDLSSGEQIADWAKGAWDTISGNNQYRAPENVFNPAAWYNPANSNSDRTQQLTAAGQMNDPNNYYAGLMKGTSPSLADNQMKTGIGLSNVQGMQSASAARGIDRAAAFRQAQNNAAQLNAQGAIAGGQQRLQEQQLGAQGYSQGLQGQSNMYGTTRQQDINEQLGLGSEQNQAQQNLNQQYQINAGITNANTANQQKTSGAILSTIGSAIGSDIRTKENIAPLGPNTGAMSQAYAGAPGVVAVAPQNQNPFTSFGQSWAPPQQDQQQAPPQQQSSDSSNPLSSFGGMLSDERSKENLEGVHGYKFDYKDGDAHRMATEAAQRAYVQAFADAKRPREGVMAQDLASNPNARETVVQDQNGRLGIDLKRATGFILANQASLNDRLNALEGRGAR